jgi:nicotinamide N-methyltransferase
VPVRPRQLRGTKLVNNPPTKAKRRERSDTASTNRTGTGTITRHSVDSPASATPRHSTLNDGSPAPQREDKIPGQVDSETDGTDLLTPTAETPHTLERQSLRRVASGASLTALSPAAPTPALTPTMTITTDESDTDFQSACSASPRDSYGSFENKKALQHDSDDSGTSTDQYQKRHVTEYTDLPIMRARLSSTATAVPQTSPTLSDIITAPSGRGFATRSRQVTN